MRAMNTTQMNYIVTSKGMTPFSSTETIAEAIADAVRARRQGLDGQILPEDDASMEATPADCDEAASLLGLDRDPASEDMDSPVNANIVAGDLWMN